jgi:4'-phosphopantetheinyl transferase
MKVSTFIVDKRILERDDIYISSYNKMPKWRKKKIDATFKIEAKMSLLAASAAFTFGMSKLNLKADAEKIKFNEFGKPSFEEDCGVFFNISHSKGFAICTFGVQNLGCDIECIDETRISDELINRVLTESEKKYLDSLDNNKKVEEFFRIWTYKESYLKYIGVGIKGLDKSFSINLVNNKIEVDGEVKDNIYFKEYDLSGYKITICSSDSDFEDSLIKVEL